MEPNINQPDQFEFVIKSNKEIEACTQLKVNIKHGEENFTTDKKILKLINESTRRPLITVSGSSKLLIWYILKSLKEINYIKDYKYDAEIKACILEVSEETIEKNFNYFSNENDLNGKFSLAVDSGKNLLDVYCSKLNNLEDFWKEIKITFKSDKKSILQKYLEYIYHKNIIFIIMEIMLN